MTVEHAKIAWDGGAVSVIWDHADRAETVLVLGHGAGGTLHVATAWIARVGARL